MNDFLNDLPSVGNMFKLIVFLILALIVIGLVAAIVKVLMPLLVVAAILIGGYYLFNQWQEKNKRSI